MYNYVLKNLIISFRKQDMTAFGIIFDEFKGLINFYSNKLCDDDLAGELTLFLIELLYKINLNRFSPDKNNSIKKYIAVSIRNKYIALSKSLNKEKLLKSYSFDDEIKQIPFNEDDICIKEALEYLTERQRNIIVYKYVYCLSDSQISQMLNISRQAVNKLKNKGLKELKLYYDI